MDRTCCKSWPSESEDTDMAKKCGGKKRKPC